MAVDMGTVWDRTTEFLSDHFGAIFPVVALTIWLPQIVSTLIGASHPGSLPSAGQSLLALALVLPSMWGWLALTAHALDPDAGAAAARRDATRGFGWALLIWLLFCLALIVLYLPMPIVLVAGGLDIAALQRGDMAGAFAAVSDGARSFVRIYAIVLLVLALVIGVRATVLAFPALIAERVGVAAIGRAFALSRGITLKMIGVYLLFFLVMAVGWMAVNSAAGALFAMVAPGAGPFGFGSIAVAALSGLVLTIAYVIMAAFSARLYRAVTGGAAKPA